MEIILFIAVIIFLIWTASLSNRVNELERRLKQGDVPSQRQAAASYDYQTLQKNDDFEKWKEQSANLPPPKPPLVPPLKPQMTEAQATEVATNWLNKIGVVALLLGMVFFFKYAIDQGWINELMRVIIGFLVSGLLVVLGELWKDKFGKRAQGLSGGGIGLFYFTIFAAYQFYHILPQPAAWFLMLVIAALSVLLSFRYSSLVLGVLGFFGAYGSPLLLSSGRDQQIALLVYLTILNVVAVILCLKKFWVELIFLALLGTTLDFAGWGYKFSNAANTFPSVFFVILTVAILGVGSAVLLRFHKQRGTLLDLIEKNLSAIYIFAGAFYFAVQWLLLEKNYHSFLGPIALLGSVTFFLIYAFVDRLEYKILNYCLSFVGSWLLVYAAVWQFDGKTLALALLAIALLGAVLGFVLKREEIRVWALIILFASLFKALYEPYGVNDKVFLFNAKFGLMFANTLGLLLIGWIYSKFEASEFEKNTEKVLQVVAAVILWFAVSWDVFVGLRPNIYMRDFMTLWWVIYPVALAGVGVAGKRKGLLQLSVLLLCAGLVKVLILPYHSGSSFLFNAKFGLMFAQAAAIFIVGWLYTKDENKSESQDAFFAVGSLLLWFAVSWDIAKYFTGYQSVNSRNLFLSLWWVIYAVILMAVGGLMKLSIFRKLSIALFGLSILKVFLYDVQALDTPYRIVAFIVLGVILLSVSFSYRKNKDKIVNFLEGEEKGKIQNEHQ